VINQMEAEWEIETEQLHVIFEPAASAEQTHGHGFK